MNTEKAKEQLGQAIKASLPALGPFQEKVIIDGIVNGIEQLIAVSIAAHVEHEECLEEGKVGKPVTDQCPRCGSTNTYQMPDWDDAILACTDCRYGT